MKKSIFSALLGTFSHIILDAPLYNDMNPFLPIMGNPLFGVVYPTVPYVICSISFILGLVVLLVRFRSWEQFIDKFDVRQLMKKQALFLLIVIVGLSIILFPLVLFFLTSPIDDSCFYTAAAIKAVGTIGAVCMINNTVSNNGIDGIKVYNSLNNTLLRNFVFNNQMNGILLFIVLPQVYIKKPPVDAKAAGFNGETF